MSSAQIEPLGDSALLLRLGDRIEPALSRRILALAAAIETRRPPWLRDCVPAYASLALFINTDAFPGGEDPLDVAEAWLKALIDTSDSEHAPPKARLVEIPVRYGSVDGPDLISAAQTLGIAPEELIARHSTPRYTVAMLGFAPGFPYLLGLDPSLNLPRLATPRATVPAGSVGIGGGQTGIYPNESPGGWQLLGRTALTLFDARRDPPTLLQPGDSVRFVPVADVAGPT